MPASVAGHMLWPTSSLVTQWGVLDGYTSWHGFVDETGRLVVPERYEDYAYCQDATGRVSFVVAIATGKKADVLDLTGRVIAHAPTQVASCGPPGLVVFTRVLDAELGNDLDGLMDVATGDILLAHAGGRKLAVVNADTVNVTEPKGEYFLNPRTGKRTFHPGWVADAGLEPGAPGLPASTVQPNGPEGGRSGYVGLNGAWLVKPAYVDASGFRNGYAVVQLGEDRFTFLNAKFQRVGGEWTSIETVDEGATATNGWSRTTVGYLVSGPAGQSLLGGDLHVIVASGTAKITCASDANGACSVLDPAGRASLAVLPKGTLTVMPDGFTGVISRTFVSDKASSGDDPAAHRVLSLAGGRALELDGGSACHAVATVYAACEPGSAVLPPVVIDAEGRRTAFATIQAVGEPTSSGGATYYWVVAGKYQGFIDASGAWRYRESRYTRVEE
jgi:hypothetical protein